MTRGTIAGCDDYDEIVAWGNEHLDLWRQNSEFYFGIPQEDWLRTLMNGIDNDPANAGLPSIEINNEGHGRLETRTHPVSHDVAQLGGQRRYPGEPRFPGLVCLIQTTTRSEHAGHVSEQICYYISCAQLTPERAAQAIRGHWGIESLHWMFDVIFNEDLSRLRRAHGARNMALCAASPSSCCAGARAKPGSKPRGKSPVGAPTTANASSDQRIA